jgi:DNA-binding transcriptional MerR regulator
MQQLTVGKVAERTGTSADTIRYYDRLGLLPEPDRTPAGYRVYGDDVVEHLELIRQAQRLGLKLAEIRELLQVRRDGLCPCGHARALLERRAEELDRELAVLTRLREDLRRMLDEPSPAGSGWSCAGGPIPLGRRPHDDRGATP